MIKLLSTDIVRVKVLYYIPRTLLLNEFVWDTEDRVPELLRVHKFLRYWRENIEATISEVSVTFRKTNEIRIVDHLERIDPTA